MEEAFNKWRKKACLTVLAIAVHSPASAEVTTGRAEYLYGPETAQNDACSLATKKAISHALRQVSGEYATVDELLSCYGSTGKNMDYSCELNQLSWSQIDGYINKTISQEVTTSNRDGAMVCAAVVTLDVGIPITKPDPNFQLRASVNSSTFRVRQKDKIRLEVELSQLGYFAVFNWLPHIDNAVHLIEPDPQKARVSRLIKSETSLEFPIAWSDAYSSKRKFYDEYLIVVATKKELRWLSKYSYEEFSRALYLIPESEKRLTKIAVQLTNE